MEQGRESTEQNSVLDYFTSKQWLVFACLAFFGLLFRWGDLGVKPMHHDESIHAMFGKYYFDFPDHNFYKYDPTYHGPLLYHLLRLVYLSLGSSEFAARFPIAVLGSAFIFVPLLFRRYFTPIGVLALSGAIALSPSLIYWSRFVIHDYLVVACQLLVLYGICLAPTNRKVFPVIFGLGIAWCIKASILVTLSIVLGYLIFDGLMRLVLRRDGESIFKRGLDYLRGNPFEALAASVIVAFFFFYFYSAGFRYGWTEFAPNQGERPVTSFLGQVWYWFMGGTFDYWLRQHSIERIQGPFAFNLYFLGWYELVFIVALIINAYYVLKSSNGALRNLFLLTAGAGLLVAFYYAKTGLVVTESEFFKPFKLKDPIDICWLFILTAYAVLLPFYHYLRSEKLLAVTGYFFLANFWTYSFLGEKVPWLTIYPLTAGLVYLVLYFEDHFKKFPIKNYQAMSFGLILAWSGVALFALGGIFVVEDLANFWNNLFILGMGVALFALGVSDHYLNFFGRLNLCTFLFVGVALFNARIAYLTNYTFAGEASEFISQVHTTREFDELMHRLRDDIMYARPGQKPTVFITGDATWPATWYLRDLPEYKFMASEEEKLQFDYQIIDWKENDPNLPAGFDVRRINLRGWWVPEYREMTFKKYLLYALSHHPWSGTGFSYVNLLTRKK